MTKNIDKIKISLGDSVFNHISSLNKNQLEKQLSELKSELNLADKKSQRYTKLKDEEWYILYRLERTNEFKYAEGGGVGSISNQYDGKTGKKVWESWTATQKAHFLKDHFYSVGKKLPTKNIFAMKWSELPLYLQNAVSNHVYAGQYAKGGGVESKEVVNTYINYNDAEELWNSWSLKQKFHFLKDHFRVEISKAKNESELQKIFWQIEDTARMKWGELPRMVQMEIETHKQQGQYAKGGSVGSSFEYTIGGL